MMKDRGAWWNNRDEGKVENSWSTLPLLIRIAHPISIVTYGAIKSLWN
jgi:hypothetical protein